MEIKAAQVNELRKMTGVGMMDCKNALVEAEGDFDKAIDILRKKGQKVAAKRADRTADQGRVVAKVNADSTKGYILVLSCETDFVGKNAEFVAASEQFIDLAMKANAKTREEVLALDVDGRTIADHISDLMGKTSSPPSTLSRQLTSPLTTTWATASPASPVSTSLALMRPLMK